ncbi:MAG: hypothetical protein WDO74_36865 [Pseudomonadota bacterium]
MRDLRAAGVDILTLGQYLRPTPKHAPVERYVTPERFDEYAREGREMGFAFIASGPLVRSSYHAAEGSSRLVCGLPARAPPGTAAERWPLLAAAVFPVPERPAVVGVPLIRP